MILRKTFASVYPLNARSANGQRLETDTLVDAVYTIEQGADELVRKTLSGGGLEIRHSDALGDAYLYVIINNQDIQGVGKALQRLYITDCQGNRFPVTLRPEYVYIEA